MHNLDYLLKIPRLSQTPEYRAWKGMMYRCYNPNDKGYKNYGRRGIKVYDEWKDNFLAFYDWIITILGHVHLRSIV